MRQIMKMLRQRLLAGESMAMVTVVTRSGSAPRGAGARMLVDRTGRVAGTVGGGAVEYEAERIAVESIAQGTCFLREFSLTQEEIAGLGMVCGGAVTLYFQVFRGGDEEAADQAARMERLLDAGERSWLVLTMTGQDAGHTELVSAAEDPERFARLEILTKGRDLFMDEKGQRCYAELLNRGGSVYVFGGGHVARELVPALAHIGFRCVVLEDRPEFACANLFPDARRVILTEFNEILRVITPTAADYAVVMTRGHQHDYLVQRELLKTAVGYIGVMGSKSKKAYVFEKLREDGFADADIARITTPIGLSIGAETPEEIAVSIAAQLIERRAARK